MCADSYVDAVSPAVKVMRTAEKGNCLFSMSNVPFGQQVFNEPLLIFSPDNLDLLRLVEEVIGLSQTDLQAHWYVAAIQTLLYSDPGAHDICLSKWCPPDGKISLSATDFVFRSYFFRRDPYPPPKSNTVLNQPRTSSHSSSDGVDLAVQFIRASL